METTRLRGARTHNLKNVDLALHAGEMVVIAGVSGSGKSSLALDTLYAEGQRRFVESFSAYARQFLERRDRPPVDSLDPVPAAIAVDRGAPVRTSRSTVGTMTELADYLRLLWARASTLTCESCGREVRRGTVTAAVESVLSPEHHGARAVFTWTTATGDAERYLGERERMLEEGWRRALVHREGVWSVCDLDEIAPSEAVAAGGLRVVVDRLVLGPNERSRITEALATALARNGRAEVHLLDRAPVEVLKYSRGLVCAHCDRAYPDASDALFSFHSPIGACETCRGFGRVIDIDWEKVVPDAEKSIAEGAIKPWTSKVTEHEKKSLEAWCKKHKVATDKAWRALPEARRHDILEGCKDFDGVRPWFQWLETRTYQMHVRVFLSRFRKYQTCGACGGSRLRPESARYRVANMAVHEANAVPVEELRARLGGIEPSDEATDRIVAEVRARLGYLTDVGVGYLTLDRSSRTLSGGEVQRVALTAALGTSLTGTMMVLDEPTAGLHPRDAARLIEVARGIASLGNVAVVIEHDLGVIASADRVVELGPDAGERGGAVVYDGPPSGMLTQKTPTAQAFSSLTVEPRKRRVAKHHVEITGARGHNLKGVHLRVPIGVLTCVTGVSGSGKSSLVGETLYPAIARARGEALDAPLPFDTLVGDEHVRAIHYVDQGPLGRTTRGNAATYLKVYERIRARFAASPESKSRGYSARTFSFNVEGGRCETCQGAGSETVEMQFLADVSFRCPDCQGRRFRDEVLEVRVRGHSIADVLEMSADALVVAFDDDRALCDAVLPLRVVGLGYLRMGQSLSTLSGGEAQRIKLAAAMLETRKGDMLILDEPTTGLHRRDVAVVFDTLEALVDRGVSVVVVEHDPYVAARADWVIDLGPEAAHRGGTLVAEGTPETVAAHETSRFAPYLREALGLVPSSALALLSAGRVSTASGRASDAIEITGAREHNLSVPSLKIPREKLVAMTGPSGSGKSSLAFDVVYAEGQRRFLETLSPYARQYLPSLGRADVDAITGIPPAISLEQRTARGGVMSTVATVTEVAHYLRLLFAKAATPYCPTCDLPIGARTPEVIVDDLAASLPPNANLSVFAPVVRGRKGSHGEPLERARRSGIEAVRVDGVDYDIKKVPELKKTKEHDIWLWLGRSDAGDRKTLLGLVRQSMSIADGNCIVERDERTGRVGDPWAMSSRRACPKCGTSQPELDPRHFSFNTPQGRCERCEGRGTDENGKTCSGCKGSRLAAVPRAVRLGSLRFHEAAACTPGELRDALRGLTLSGRERLIGEAPLAELESKLTTLLDLGLGYLTLDRRADSLSGGEMQRLRLAAQIGAGLTGVLYVLDEPTIGLHGTDTARLIRAMRALVARGASVVVVEHDAEVIRAADWVVDLGPAGGKAGGKVMAEGPAEKVLAGDGPTAQALRVRVGEGGRARPTTGASWLTVKGAEGHNLKVPKVSFPLGRLVCVAGVSGSGKSTLVEKITLRAVREKLGLETEKALKHSGIDGVQSLKRAIAVDQSPIGRTPRSVPATYVGFWDELRKLFAATAEARARGWGIGRFSFNTTSASGGGRCEACEGAGVQNVEMAFLPDVVIPCDSCGGTRFTRETREVKLHGYDAGEVLGLTVEEARLVFQQVPKVSRPLAMLHDLGLGYLSLGQGSHTLSGGEAQRIKLVTELQSPSGSTLYVLDEPTTGLHLSDVARLIGVMQKLVDRGDSLLVIEHHPSVLAAADWIVELGPGGGREGGTLVASGTPRTVSEGNTATGSVLRGA